MGSVSASGPPHSRGPLKTCSEDGDDFMVVGGMSGSDADTDELLMLKGGVVVDREQGGNGAGAR
jgi:hypothetical protein